MVEIPLEPFGEGPYFARIANAMNLCYMNTGIHLGISFRYVDNIMVLNEDKINNIGLVLKRGIETMHEKRVTNAGMSVRSKCPF